ncbi:MAG: lipocalin-like domain-containing protein [Gammaproteobacteria bacterium]|nr:lipocalin-like domain-containing protein [Gammaproteobacteria bacterium]
MKATDADARLAAALVGSWQLVRWTIGYPGTDRVTEPFGPKPEGLLLYTADGYMSAAMQKRGRPRLSHADVRSVTDAEKAAAFGSYLNYSGRWHVAGGCVIHEVECSMNPNLIGTRQVRRAALAGSTLELTAEELLERAGRMRVHRIDWRRATSRD